MPHLTEIPAEILEQIFLHLPGQDIVKMEVINQRFQDLTRSSPALQYRRDLFAAGLIDNPHHRWDLGERRRLCKEYVRRWSDATTAAKCFREVLLEPPFSDWHYKITLGRNLLANRSHHPDKIDFLRISLATSRKRTERWSIPQFPFKVLYHTAYPPEDILVALELKEGFIRIHLFNLLDGSPYRAPPLNIIAWEIPPGVGEGFVDGLAMTGSRLMVVIYFLDGSRPHEERVWRVIIWDWKTGDLVFDFSSADGSVSITSDPQIAFLDEFRVMIAHCDGTTELSVFNTLVPQDHPENLRRFKLPQKYHERVFRVHLDHDRSRGMVNRDGPLIVDPTQDIFIMDFARTPREPRVLLVMRTQGLIGFLCSKRADVQISWEEWGRDAVVMDIPISSIRSSIVIHGSRLLAVSMTGGGPEAGHRIHIFDFSRRGTAALQLSGGDDGGAWRRAVFDDGFVFERHEVLDPWEPHSLGDSVAFLVESLSEPDHSECVLRVFDMM